LVDEIYNNPLIMKRENEKTDSGSQLDILGHNTNRTLERPGNRVSVWPTQLLWGLTATDSRKSTP
jgi:hypothetical protein